MAIKTKRPTRKKPGPRKLFTWRTAILWKMEEYERVLKVMVAAGDDNVSDTVRRYIREGLARDKEQYGLEW